MTYTPPPPANPPPPPPPPVPPPPPPGMPPAGAPRAGGDKVTLWGVIGIVTALCCCGVLGIVFGWLSVREAKQFGKSPVLGYIAIALGVLAILRDIFVWPKYLSGQWKMN